MDAQENETNVVEDVIDDNEEEEDNEEDVDADENEEDVEEEEEDGPLDWQGEGHLNDFSISGNPNDEVDEGDSTASESEQDDADTEASAKKSKNKSTFADLFEEFDPTKDEVSLLIAGLDLPGTKESTYVGYKEEKEDLLKYLRSSFPKLMKTLRRCNVDDINAEKQKDAMVSSALSDLLHEIFNVVFSPTILSVFTSKINEGLETARIDESDMRRFIKAFALMKACGVSKSKFYDRPKENGFNFCTDVCDRETFNKIVQRLGKEDLKSGKHHQAVGEEHTSLRKAFNQFSSYMGNTFIVLGETILSFDDDAIRKRQTKAMASGLQIKMNKAKKCFGPTATTGQNLRFGFIVGAKMQNTGESCGDTIINILKATYSRLQGESAYPMNGTLFATDRGYTNKKFLKTLVEEWHASFLGTYPKIPSFPYVAESSKKKGSSQKAIADNGHYAPYGCTDDQGNVYICFRKATKHLSSTSGQLINMTSSKKVSPFEIVAMPYENSKRIVTLARKAKRIKENSTAIVQSVHRPSIGHSPDTSESQRPSTAGAGGNTSASTSSMSAAAVSAERRETPGLHTPTAPFRGGQMQEREEQLSPYQASTVTGQIENGTESTQICISCKRTYRGRYKCADCNYPVHMNTQCSTVMQMNANMRGPMLLCLDCSGVNDNASQMNTMQASHSVARGQSDMSSSTENSSPTANPTDSPSQNHTLTEGLQTPKSSGTTLKRAAGDDSDVGSTAKKRRYERLCRSEMRLVNDRDKQHDTRSSTQKQTSGKRKEGIREILEHELNKECQELSESQGGQEWFVLRKFHLTSTTSMEAVKWIKQRMKTWKEREVNGTETWADEDFVSYVSDTRIAEFLGGIYVQNYNNDSGLENSDRLGGAEEESDSVGVKLILGGIRKCQEDKSLTPLDDLADQLKKTIKKDDLKTVATAKLQLKGLSSANMEKLFEAIKARVGEAIDGNVSADPEDYSNRSTVITKLVKGWFMAPRGSSTAMDIGSYNEDNLSRGLPKFLRMNFKKWDLGPSHVEHFGLLENRLCPYMATSVDGMMRISLADRRRVSAAVEFKTKSSPDELEKARNTAAKFGKTVHCNFGDSTFKKVVDSILYRNQILHHATVTNVDHVVFVVGDKREILHTAIVTVPEEVKRSYFKCCKTFGNEFMDWTNSRNNCFPNDVIIPSSSYACDSHTVNFWFKLWWSLKQFCYDVKKPFPRIRYFAPSIAVMWNFIKTGTDVVTRLNKNEQALMSQLSWKEYLYLRLIEYGLVNCYRLYQLLISSKWDDEGEDIDENNVFDSLLAVKREKKRLNSYGSFGRFLRCMAWSAHMGDSDGDESTPKSKETPSDMNTTKMSASKIFKSFKEAPKSFRLTGRHYQHQVTTRRTCALCGGGVSFSYVKNLKDRAKGKRVHVGGRPKVGCTTCAKALYGENADIDTIPLCTKKKSGSKSTCWEKWQWRD
eukprot:Nk52_evm8s2367 gene=Nk52_evmTU8s2367